MGSCGSECKTLTGAQQHWAVRHLIGLGCSAPITAWASQIPARSKELMADPSAPAGTRQEGPQHCWSSPAKLQPDNSVWFATVTCVLLHQTENSCAPQSNREHTGRLQEQGFWISQATVNLAMTLFSYLWRMVCALLLCCIRNNALWLTPRSRATVFYEASCKRQEKLLLLKLQ